MRILKLFFCFISLLSFTTEAQTIELDSDYCDWYFSIGKSKKQYLAVVPGSNINDLVCNRLIENPYTNQNYQKLSWVEDSLFTYSTAFNLEVRKENTYEFVFEGLDTYADVYLNNQLLLKSKNMFVAYKADATKLLRNGTNLLKIVFRSPVSIGKNKAMQSKIIYPADGEKDSVIISPFIRKPAFQFGWDINPRLLSCGIWRPIKINITPFGTTRENTATKEEVQPFYTLVQKNDLHGQSFEFHNTTYKRPTFIYGANYVPYNLYPLPLKTYKNTAHLQKNQLFPNRYDFYRMLFHELKDYGCNMLRVWGGGWYEDDYFYALADSFRIAIWQDFMFANTMYPGDESWISTAREEVSQNIERLKKHPSIVLWCGNNEVAVAWKNWGWMKKYAYTKEDSLKLIHDYQLFFEKIIPEEIQKQAVKVPYIPSSPISNWGKEDDFKIGDNHYWGVWHGEYPIENYFSQIPRFASEYGLPSFPTNYSINKYFNLKENQALNTQFSNRFLGYKGLGLLQKYITQYLDTPTTILHWQYASTYIQYKALCMAHRAHYSNFPYCSGSLFWQFNESWPGITWSVIDFEGNRKVPPIQHILSLIPDTQGNYNLSLNKSFSTTQKELHIVFQIKDFDGSVIHEENYNSSVKELIQNGLKIHKPSNSVVNNTATYQKISLQHHNQVLYDTLFLLNPEKEYFFKKAHIQLKKIDDSEIEVRTNKLICGLFLESKVNPEIQFKSNFLMIEPNQPKRIKLKKAVSGWALEQISYYSVNQYQEESRK